MFANLRDIYMSELGSRKYTIFCLDCNCLVCENSSSPPDHYKLVHNKQKYKLIVLYKS